MLCSLLFDYNTEGIIAAYGAVEYMCHVYVRSDGLASVLIADQEYPQRVAFSLLNKVCVNISFDVTFLTNFSGNWCCFDSVHVYCCDGLAHPEVSRFQLSFLIPP